MVLKQVDDFGPTGRKDANIDKVLTRNRTKSTSLAAGSRPTSCLQELMTDRLDVVGSGGVL